MTRRSRAREVALQLLFQFDSNPTVGRPVQEQFVRDRLRDPELEPFCLKLFDGVQAKRQEIDKQLSAAAENWHLSRMAGVDRNVLRMGAYELMFEPEAPVAAIIDEAIELRAAMVRRTRRRSSMACSIASPNFVRPRVKLPPNQTRLPNHQPNQPDALRPTVHAPLPAVGALACRIQSGRPSFAYLPERRGVDARRGGRPCAAVAWARSPSPTTTSHRESPMPKPLPAPFTQRSKSCPESR